MNLPQDSRRSGAWRSRLAAVPGLPAAFAILLGCLGASCAWSAEQEAVQESPIPKMDHQVPTAH